MRVSIELPDAEREILSRFAAEHGYAPQGYKP